MPCNSDYLEPSEREQQLRRAAKLTVYALKALGEPVSPECEKAANALYCRADYTHILCSVVRSMTPQQLDKVVYDGRNPEARDLADWWDRHKAADEARLAAQAKKTRQLRVASDTLSTLTPEQVEALREYFGGN